ncbi:hypothetical protein [Bosea sp. AS-1]|uniref:DUF7940 domain-containing protein n=1 Tax=Bosea sp. AS-1 TaxID=2015316 RepID=UPI000B7883BD|nr:hypothetical protein [Bosea sp. AS-1]
MKLVTNWRRVLKSAWSLHTNILIVIACALDSGMTYWVDGRVSASLFVGVASGFAAATRLIKQDKVSGGDQ